MGIVVGMAVMIVTVAITTGFQREVRAKVTGAGSHLQITSIRQTDPKETPRIPIDRPYYPWLDTLPEVAHIQIYATKPGIIETAGEIEGVIVKGVGPEHDWSFLRRHLVEGTLPNIGDTAYPMDILLSRYLGRRLDIRVTDTITVYLVRGREDIRPRRFRVSGFYETGLEQMDHQLVYVDIDHLQRFSLWGLKAEILVHDEVLPEGIQIEALAFGGDRIYRYHWPGTDLNGKGPHVICVHRDTTIQLVVTDAAHTLPDTSWIRIRPRTSPDGPCADRSMVDMERGGSGGSHRLYAGGFEVFLNDFDRLDDMDQLVYHRYLETGERSLSVRDRFPEIFAWLELLDTNVWVVIILMVIVAIINMTSALLIIILERTRMIGILKALGSSNGQIRRVFLMHAFYILGMGILFGDLVGIGVCLLQRHLEIITLPIESYYVDAVPVVIEFWPIFLLNAGTLAVCLLALLVPSMLVTRIAPVRAIRFA